MERRISHLKASHYFTVASRTLSYTKAAEQLNVSQAAVSQQIRLLEDYLGVILFYRSGREMRLTSQGKQLAEHLNTAFQWIEKGLQTIKREPLEGTLQVSGLQSFASLWLMPRLWRFSGEYDEVVIKLLSSDEREDLHSGNVDISIDNQISTDEDAEQVCLLSSPVIPICSPELTKKSIPFHSPGELLKYWLIQVDTPSYSWKNWFTQQNITPLETRKKLWAEVSAWYMGISAVKAGHGIFLCPEFMVQEELEKGSLVCAYPEALNTPINFYIHYSKNSPRLSRIEAFVTWLIKEAQEDMHQRPNTFSQSCITELCKYLEKHDPPV